MQKFFNIFKTLQLDCKMFINNFHRWSLAIKHNFFAFFPGRQTFIVNCKLDKFLLHLHTFFQIKNKRCVSICRVKCVNHGIGAQSRSLILDIAYVL